MLGREPKPELKRLKLLRRRVDPDLMEAIENQKRKAQEKEKPTKENKIASIPS